MDFMTGDQSPTLHGINTMNVVYHLSAALKSKQIQIG